ncbi:PASTA domain-containing protein [Coprothermobacteraceae bacterium]|nr:PASTA domain-containing protein [Coprothermobacteraceae bacterium]
MGHKVKFWSAVLIMLLALSVASTASAQSTGRIPLVTGLTINQALARLAENHYTAAVEYEYATVSPGIVIAQTPDGGILAPPGQQVKLVVSKGVRLVEIPNVVGMSGAEAIDNIRSLGLRLGTITELQTGQRFVVIGQEPKPGQLTVEGDVVSITVGIPKLVRVPAVIGLTLDQALTQIKASGLSVGKVTRTATSSTEIEVVKSQSPRSGVYRYQGTAVDLEVWSPK